MRIRLKKYLNKHKNRIFSLIAVMVFIPMFSFNAFAYEASANSLVELKEAMRISVYGSKVFTVDHGSLFNENLSHYDFDFGGSSGFSGLTHFDVKTLYDPWVIQVNDDYDYYLYTSVYSTNRGDEVLTDFVPDVFTVYNYDYSTASSVPLSIENLVVSKIGSETSEGFSTFCKVNFGNFTNIDKFDYIDNNGGRLGHLVYFQAAIVIVPKDATSDELNSIVNAINNQTSSLGGKIDDTNDFINNGNGSTGSIVIDNNSAVDNLNEVVSEYHATEQQFFDDFTANQQAINSDIVGWSWGGLVNCANWVGETMTDYYNNMGDFRQYIIYPLMLGIVLFFLGRGGAIIGHLFRKPTQSTVNIESTSFKRGNTRYTTTTTSRKGGVFRK